MAFTPTHSVPRTAGGIATWPAPDPTAAEGPRLDAGLSVAVVTAQSDGWTQIECDNGWRAWVDGRLLQPVGAPPARPRRTQAQAQPQPQPATAGYAANPHPATQYAPLPTRFARASPRPARYKFAACL